MGKVRVFPAHLALPLLLAHVIKGLRTLSGKTLPILIGDLFLNWEAPEIPAPVGLAKVERKRRSAALLGKNLP